MSKIFVSKGVVANGTESVKQYMNDIKRVPMMTREEEQAAAANKDTNQLVSANLRFAVQVAKQYQGMGLELEDLIAFGNLGLFEAAERFDASRNIKFITFAVWYIRAEITKALNDMSRTVRIPSHRTSTEEYGTISTGMVMGDDETGETYADRYLAAENVATAADQRDLKRGIASALAKLNQKQAAAVKMFYGIDSEYPKCMDQIAEELNVSGERARQLVRAGEKALKQVSGIALLEEYL